MVEQTMLLESAYFRNVLNILEELLDAIPKPAYEEKGSRSITRFSFYEPVREESIDEKKGRLIASYSKIVNTEYATMAGIQREKKPLIFECCQKGDNSVEVRGLYSADEECREWIKPIFEDIWQKLLNRFSA